MKKIIYLLCFFFFSVQASSQEEWMKTTGTIKKIEKKRRGKTIAIVSFTTEEGKTTETYVELIGLPVIGTFKSTGDIIKIYYDKNNPAIVRDEDGKFLSQYGMIVLIVLGVFFSLKKFKDVKKFQN
ncbi:hypothetical protein ACSIGC_17690 [Tenacibaculum sp. ZS6-P6]|uniref:hypothetical protein n=1 Tax=Tenacibaculum sp. ZS6-P6 TaxID=3447503 RepID=UPI003F9AE554